MPRINLQALAPRQAEPLQRNGFLRHPGESQDPYCLGPGFARDNDDLAMCHLDLPTAELGTRGVRVSMDGKGRFLDNIFIERLWRSLKYEEVFIKAYAAVTEARHG